jgi:Glycosyl transferase family 2
MAIDENSELARIAERLDLIEQRLLSLEQTANSVHELLQPRRNSVHKLLQPRWRRNELQKPQPPRRPWREKFRPRLWYYQQHPPKALQVPRAYAAQAVPANAPRIAIVTPSYNSAKFLGATIDSVLAQNYPDLAYIVEDGGSTDGTVQLLESYGERIAWRSEPDTGQANAINRGFARAHGDIMAYLNSDDVLLPGALAYVAQIFLAKPDVDVVYSHRIFIDRDGAEIGRWVLPPHCKETFKWADFIPQETMFWRRRVWDKVGPIDETFQYALDWDFALRAQAAGFRILRVPRFLACFRVHDEQKSTAMREVGDSEQRRLRQAHLGYDPDYPEIHRAIRWYVRRHIVFHGLFRWGLLEY